ncbi:MAG: polysaccharide biosynthesis tyrosine autokinase [Candidatus Omnitrophica bacterium]|nr:polysaccharide biosynthesis tyrosine autokinase [Candidatus Omnitrophota bacterium]
MPLDETVSPDFVEENPQKSDYFEIFRLVFGHIRLIAGITFLGLVCFSVYYLLMPDLYTASAKIVIERSESQQPKSPQEILIPLFRGEEDYYGTQIEVLTSRKTKEAAMKELGLSPLLRYSVRASHMKDSRVIALSVTHPDPELAARIANAYVDIFVRENSSENLFISKQILQLIPETTELSGAETQGDLSSQGFNREQFVGSLPSVTADVVIRKLNDSKLQVEGELSELSQRYKPEHPTIKQLTERLGYIDQEIKERTQKIISNLRANLEGKINITNVKILEEAIPPRRPSKPNRPLGIFMGTLATFLSSSFLVFLMEYTSQKIKSEEDVQQFLNIPFLGYIPETKELVVDKGEGDRPPKSKFSSLVEALNKNSILADSVASVRTHILFSMPYERSKRIMLTSSIPDEGKSTVAVLLALSLTGLGRKILLIDADLRKPFLHRYLGMENLKGLSDYLVGSASLKEIVRSVNGSDLKVIAGGTISPNPSELLSSERFRDLLDEMSKSFDRIVIDVPPVLYIPDGLVVAKHVHSGILVCGSGMLDGKIAKTIKEKFEAIGHALIGVVINRANYEQEGYRYRYYKRYKKYYGDEGKDAGPDGSLAASWERMSRAWKKSELGMRYGSFLKKFR